MLQDNDPISHFSNRSSQRQKSKWLSCKHSSQARAPRVSDFIVSISSRIPDTFARSEIQPERALTPFACSRKFFSQPLTRVTVTFLFQPLPHECLQRLCQRVRSLDEVKIYGQLRFRLAGFPSSSSSLAAVQSAENLRPYRFPPSFVSLDPFEPMTGR